MKKTGTVKNQRQKKAKKPANSKSKKSAKKTKTAGRPAYSPSSKHIETAYKGAKKGLNEQEIAKAIGISYSTFQRNIDEFRPAVKKARDESNDENCDKVENSLLKRAIGHEFVEEHEEQRVTLKGKTIYATKKKIKKYHPASDVAIMYYLGNRRPDKWQSINNQQSGRKDSVGEIQGWFRAMEEEYEELKARKSKR